MIYVVLVAAGILVLQYFLAKNPVAGLIIPMGSIFGVIMAALLIFSADGGGWAVPNNRLTLLVFLFLTAVSFLLYFIHRRDEFRDGYRDEEKVEEKDRNPKN